MSIFFHKGKDNILESKKENEAEQVEVKKIQDAFLKVLDNKNLSFLLGSGCSSYEIEIVEEKQESLENIEEQQSEELETKDNDTESQSKKGKTQIGIPVMAPMAKEFYDLEDFKDEKDWLKTELKIDVTDSTFSTNLEMFLSTLHSLSFYHSKKSESDEHKNGDTVVEEPVSFKDKSEFQKIDSIILKARNFLLQKCLNENNTKSDKEKPSNDLPLIELYKQFYRKLLTRNPTLPRLNIFTTNYDLYSERAMDLLGIHYVSIRPINSILSRIGWFYSFV